MPEKGDSIDTGARIGQKYQLIRKQPPGGGGPVFIGILEERKIPVHIRFYSESLIPDMKNFNERLKKAKEAHSLAPDHITLPSDYGFHGNIPYAVYGVSNLKTLQVLFLSGKSPGMDDTKKIVASLLGMLERVHGKGIVHLGLSPLSIHQKEGGFMSVGVGVIDFALAPDKGHDYFSRPAENEKLRSIAAYVSPEQASGGEADYRADLYGIGAIAYRMVMGTPPFDGKSPAEIMENAASEKPLGLDPPGEGLTGEMAGFLARALEKTPEARFQSAAEMLDAFEAAAGGQPGRVPADGIVRQPEALGIKSPVPSHTPIVIFKVGEETAAGFEEVSDEESTLAIEAQDRKDKYAPGAPREEKEAAPAMPRKKKEKTDLFIQVPPEIAAPKDGKEAAPRAPEPTEAVKASPPPVPAKPPLPAPGGTPGKAKHKADLFIKVPPDKPPPAPTTAAPDESKQPEPPTETEPPAKAKEPEKDAAPLTAAAGEEAAGRAAAIGNGTDEKERTTLSVVEKKKLKGALSDFLKKKPELSPLPFGASKSAGKKPAAADAGTTEGARKPARPPAAAPTEKKEAYFDFSAEKKEEPEKKPAKKEAAAGKEKVPAPPVAATWKEPAKKEAAAGKKKVPAPPVAATWKEPAKKEAAAGKKKVPAPPVAATWKEPAKKEAAAGKEKVPAPPEAKTKKAGEKPEAAREAPPAPPGKEEARTAAAAAVPEEGRVELTEKAALLAAAAAFRTSLGKATTYYLGKMLKQRTVIVAALAALGVIVIVVVVIVLAVTLGKSEGDETKKAGEASVEAAETAPEKPQRQEEEKAVMKPPEEGRTAETREKEADREKEAGLKAEKKARKPAAPAKAPAHETGKKKQAEGEAKKKPAEVKKRAPMEKIKGKEEKLEFVD